MEARITLVVSGYGSVILSFMMESTFLAVLGLCQIIIWAISLTLRKDETK